VLIKDIEQDDALQVNEDAPTNKSSHVMTSKEIIAEQKKLQEETQKQLEKKLADIDAQAKAQRDA